MSFTSSLKFLSLAYLSFVLQSNVGCFRMGPLFLGPMFSALAVPTTDMTCIVTLAALYTACVMYSLVFVCSLSILLLCLIFVFCFWVCLCEIVFFYCLDLLRLPNISCFSLPFSDILLLTPCSISCLSEDDTDVWSFTYLLLCMNELNFYNKYMCLYIQMWYTLVGYIHDADWLYYLHKSGHTSWCSIVRLGHP